MNKSKRKSATVFSRDEIGVEQLQSLKEKFADGDLNEKEFVSLFREIIDASLSETQLTELFQKIDANSDGTVDWDELTNYMFLSGSDNSAEFIGDDGNAFYETYQPDKFGELSGDGKASGSGGSGSNFTGSGAGSSLSGGSSTSAGSGSDASAFVRPTYHHKDLITRVIRLEKPYLYLTASKDGSVRTWNAHTMQFQSLLTTGRNWLTDCCVMRRSNRLAVTSMNRTLGIYDLGSNALIGEIHEYSKRQAIPLCVEYVEKPADDREALVIGDDTGGITVMTCSDQWLACDGRSTTSTATASGASASGNGTAAAVGSGSGSSSSSSSSAGAGAAAAGSGSSGGSSSSTTSGSTGIGSSGSASLEAQGFSTRTRFKRHTDWVTRVKWVNDIRAVVATSLDTNISIIDIDRMVVKFEYNRHKKGVFDLVWCASTRLIASCGMERDISIWNPYSSQRAVATLRGHTSSVVHLVSDDDNYQIISVSSDNTFKVWDVRNHRCLQTWVDKAKSTGGAENRISALLFDAKQPCLVSGTTHLTRWPFKVQSEDEDGSGSGGSHGTGKEKPMCVASYNGVFHQVVTAEMSAESIVKTWSAETGDEICSFSNAHGSNPVTAISFDYPGRRLLTGSHDGALINMWNFSNGALVKQFLKEQDTSAVSVPSGTTTSSSSSSGVSGSGTSTSGAASGSGATSSLLDDLSFLGLDGGGDGDDEPMKHGAKPATASTTSTTTTTATAALPSSPRRRAKVRDIMLLPSTFGVDVEGRKNASALSEYAELPSPIRTRLRPHNQHGGGEQKKTFRKISGSPAKPAAPRTTTSAIEPTPPPAADAPIRTPRARRHSSLSSRSFSVTHVAADAAAALLEASSVGSATETRSKYCEKEVTSILDIERNLRVGMGDYICQRFVCCVGWDRQIFVWADKNDESEALPIHVLPNPKTLLLPGNATKCHTMDILALVYIPPAYIATAGLDGAILLWSINSGDFLSRVFQSSGSIDTMFYATKIEMLFASGETGQLICVDRTMAPRAVVKLEHPHDEAVTALRCDRSNTHLVTGDAAGYLKVWDLTIAPDHEGLVLDVCCLWRVPGASARILGLDFIEHVRVQEPCLLVASGNGDVSLWTLDGVQIGCFGRHRTWQLGRPATYLAMASSCIWPESTANRAIVAAEPGDQPLQQQQESVSPAVLRATVTVRQFLPCFSIAALNGNQTVRDTFLLEDSMPKPGEVWVCVSGHRSSRQANAANASKRVVAVSTGGGAGQQPQDPGATPASSVPSTPSERDRRDSGGTSTASTKGILPAMFRRTSNNTGGGTGTGFLQVLGAVVLRETLASLPFLQQRLSEVAVEIIDIITVVKVTRGEISCWDGNGHKPPLLKVLEMSEFVRKAGWTKQPLLTLYIGRKFVGDEQQPHFQVNGISLAPVDASKPDRKTFSLIDTNGQEHAIQPLSDAVSTARTKVHQQQQPQQPTPTQRRATASPPSVSQPTTKLNATTTTATAPPARANSRARSKHSDTTGLTTASGDGQGDPNGDGDGDGSSSESSEQRTTDANDPVLAAIHSPLTTNVTAVHALPLIKPREKRVMGGLLPKRSSVRMRHDQSVDFRRVHAPEEIPKNFRTALQQRLQASLLGCSNNGNSSNNSKINTSTSSTSASPGASRILGARASGGSARFDGVLPE